MNALPVRDPAGRAGGADVPVVLQDELVWRGIRLPGVALAAAERAPAGTRAFALGAARARGPSAAFLHGLVFGHLLPSYDGRFRLSLPAAVRSQALLGGWATTDAADGPVLVYGPRDRDELAIAWLLFCASYDYACGTRPELHADRG